MNTVPIIEAVRRLEDAAVNWHIQWKPDSRLSATDAALCRRRLAEAMGEVRDLVDKIPPSQHLRRGEVLEVVLRIREWLNEAYTRLRDNPDAELPGDIGTVYQFRRGLLAAQLAFDEVIEPVTFASDPMPERILGSELAKRAGISDVTNMNRAIRRAIGNAGRAAPPSGAGKRGVAWTCSQLCVALPYLPDGKLKKHLRDSGLRNLKPAAQT